MGAAGARDGARVGRPIALIADLQGPKLRIGDLDEPLRSRRGDDVTVAAEDGCANGELPVAPAVISDVLQPGHDVLIDDGLVRLRVDTVELGRARCTVVVGGVVSVAQGRQPARRPDPDPVADAART